MTKLTIIKIIFLGSSFKDVFICMFIIMPDKIIIIAVRMQHHIDYQWPLRILSIFLSITLLLLSGEFSVINSTVALSNDSSTNEKERCISYNKLEKIITVGCVGGNSSTHLVDIHNKLQDRDVLDREPNGVWLLNAGIVIERGSTLIIDPQDTKWLKIVADGT